MTITIPDSPAALEETLNDSEKMKELWASKEKLGEFIEGYANAVDKADRGSMKAEAREQMQLVLAEYLKNNGSDAKPPVDMAGNRAHNLRPEIKGLSSGARKSLYNRRAPGAAADGIFDDASEFFRSTWYRADRLKDFGQLRPKLEKLLEVQNSYGSEVPADGGFLIPEELRSEILQVALETAVVRPRATVIPMSSLRVPIPMIDDTSHTSSILGGVVGYWTEEAAGLTESQASFGRVVLDAKKLTAYAEVPNELLMDAPAFEGFFSGTFPKAISWFEDVAFLTGTGTGEPLGYINSPVSVQVAAEANQPAGTIVWENIVKMYAQMLPTSLGRAVWIASIDTFPQLATMALSVGTGGGPVWIGNMGGTNGGADAPPLTILGRPVYFTEKVGPLGTTGDISFVDLSYYLIGDRMEMQSSSSEHYKFANDKTAYRVIERVDGKPWLQSPLTPKNGSSAKLSPVVQLASR
ncbi:phage major capsid protein [Streptomyces sp. AK02-04a]|uniref:phage major capsid protein n=1 Tax=Streptomyces sp. AK02-04a TaxID=3028649 RepID=UPI0029A205E5|nr:phage major capsid protein [Streptomyces sp. AK02-04a]MDX3759340.1 phage major capsid protein [Streptomyces sp. AK02-04a]